MIKTTTRLLLSVLFAVTWVSVSLAANEPGTLRAQFVGEADKSLPGLVRTYLATTDHAMAEKVLNTIISRPDASIDHVVDLMGTA